MRDMIPSSSLVYPQPARSSGVREVLTWRRAPVTTRVRRSRSLPFRRTHLGCRMVAERGLGRDEAGCRFDCPFSSNDEMALGFRKHCPLRFRHAISQVSMTPDAHFRPGENLRRRFVATASHSPRVVPAHRPSQVVLSQARGRHREPGGVCETYGIPCAELPLNPGQRVAGALSRWTDRAGRSERVGSRLAMVVRA